MFERFSDYNNYPVVEEKQNDFNNVIGKITKLYDVDKKKLLAQFLWY
jgi:hypothetical protein